MRVWVIYLHLLVAGAVTAAGADEIATGRAAFLRDCAACHGVKADGRGYVARMLRHPPSDLDLRHLGAGTDTSLLADRLTRVIDGRKEVAAHGVREMPVWGERFDDLPGTGAARERAVRARINALVAYLLSIQSGATSRVR